MVHAQEPSTAALHQGPWAATGQDPFQDAFTASVPGMTSDLKEESFCTTETPSTSKGWPTLGELEAGTTEILPEEKSCLG